jgi:hypothetical protein
VQDLAAKDDGGSGALVLNHNDNFVWVSGGLSIRNGGNNTHMDSGVIRGCRTSSAAWFMRGHFPPRAGPNTSSHFHAGPTQTVLHRVATTLASESAQVHLVILISGGDNLSTEW